MNLSTLFLHDFDEQASFRMKCLVMLNRKRILEIYASWNKHNNVMGQEWVDEMLALCGHSPTYFSGPFFDGMAEYAESLGNFLEETEG
jgi:hypothetical protein